MILTGAKIFSEVQAGVIAIYPFDESCVNPNSYNYHLGPLLKMSVPGNDGPTFRDIEFGDDGYVLIPNTLYLGHTAERIGSSRYAMSLIGRSSLGRLGLFVQLSANLGHTGSDHQWTLEIYACQPIKVYPAMIIGQVSFWMNSGLIVTSAGHYKQFDSPQVSQLHDAARGLP